MAVNKVITTLLADDRTKAAFSSLGSSMSGSVLSGNLMANAMGGAFNAIASTVGSLTRSIGSGLSEAMDRTVARAATAGDFMKLTGLSFDTSTSYIKDFSKEMSLVAAALPGETAQFVQLANGIMDDLVPAFKALDGSFDLKGFREAQKEITKFATVRAENTGVDVGRATHSIAKSIGGAASLKELNRMVFFQKNPGVMASMLEQERLLGTTWKKATSIQRVEMLKTALSIPPEAMATMIASSKGLIEGFKSALLDPLTGYFGNEREFEMDGGLTSVFAQFEIATTAIFGADGLISTLSKLLGVAGADGDEGLTMMARGIQSMTAFIRNMNGWLRGLMEPMKALEGADMGIVEKMLSVMRGADVGGIIGRAIGEGLNALAAGIGAVLANGDLWAILGQVLRGIVQSLDLGAAIALVGVALIPATVGLLTGVAMTGIGMIGTAIAAGLAGVTLAVALPFIAAAAGIVAIGVAVHNHRASIMAALESAMSAISGIFSAIASKVNGILNNLGSSIVSSSAVVAQRSAPGIVMRPSVSPPSTAVSRNVVGRAMGHIPTLLAQEMAQAPTGSTAVIANSSELILNQLQQKMLFNTNGGGDRAPRAAQNLTFGDVIVNGASGDVKAIASSVIAEIEARIKTSQILGAF